MSGKKSSFLYKAKELKEGYNLIAGPGNSDLKLLELGRVFLPSQKIYNAETSGNEECLCILGGKCDVEIETTTSDKVSFLSIGDRKNAFSGNPSMVYVPSNSGYTIKGAAGETHLAVFKAPSRRNTLPLLKEGRKLKTRTFGKDNWKRNACVCLDESDDADRLLVGETVNPSGNWSSYPPHKHDTASAAGKASAGEIPMEEIYFYLLDPPQGFGIQRIYTDKDVPDPLEEVYVVENGDAVVIPRGYHPLVAGPGYRLYYLWGLAGDSRGFGAWSVDPRHAWIK